MAIDVTVDFKDFGGFEEAMKQFFREELATSLPFAAITAEFEVKLIVNDAIIASPEYGSLLSGDLLSQFGLPDPRIAVQSVIDAVVHALRVEVLKPTPSSLGGLSVSILRDDFSDALSAEGATYVSVSVAKGTSKTIPWLAWLLLEGDKIVLTGYEINLSAKGRAASRTGSAIMVGERSPTSLLPPRKSAFRPWRVPPEFSGTISDNWLTRAIGNVSEQINEVLAKAVAEA
jgi:hypothetical protein